MAEYVLSLKIPELNAVYSSYDVMKSAAPGKTLLINVYGLTEAFGDISHFTVEGSYDIVPIGRAYENMVMEVLDENGCPSPVNEIGELCFVNRFFRGYKNNPELTERTVVNGWIHTGDLGYRDAEGLCYCLGRKVDVMKTPAGFIIPKYIEAALRKNFPGIERVYVKLFGDPEGPRIAVYYIGPETISSDAIRETVLGVLPAPAEVRSRRMTEFPLFPSGKIRRLLMREPQK